MEFNLPPVYPITDVRLSGQSHADQVRHLVAAGARFIQLREKHASPLEFYTDALEAVRIARDNRAKIIINDRVDIAIAVEADGVHLGQDDLPPAEARKLLGSDAVIGWSTHSVEQAMRGVEMPVDYIAVGPVFGTSTKADPDPVVGLDGIRRVREAVGTFPLVAIGGITADNIADVFSAGADSAAVISSLFGPGGIAASYNQLASVVLNIVKEP